MWSGGHRHTACVFSFCPEAICAVMRFSFPSCCRCVVGARSMHWTYHTPSLEQHNGQRSLVAMTTDFTPVVKVQGTSMGGGCICWFICYCFFWAKWILHSVGVFGEETISLSLQCVDCCDHSFCPQMFPIYHHSSLLIGFAFLLLRCC